LTIQNEAASYNARNSPLTTHKLVTHNSQPVVVFQSDAGALEKQDPDELTISGQHFKKFIHKKTPE
jgi:hypothetical protein